MLSAQPLHICPEGHGQEVSGPNPPPPGSPVFTGFISAWAVRGLEALLQLRLCCVQICTNTDGKLGPSRARPRWLRELTATGGTGRCRPRAPLRRSDDGPGVTQPPCSGYDDCSPPNPEPGGGDPVGIPDTPPGSARPAPTGSRPRHTCAQAPPTAGKRPRPLSARRPAPLDDPRHPPTQGHASHLATPPPAPSPQDAPARPRPARALPRCSAEARAGPGTGDWGPGAAKGRGGEGKGVRPPARPPAACLTVAQPLAFLLASSRRAAA
ncbi:basic proline-rich protein-like [Aquila chrysaetos chrysaetos]|uniref:basic proline-rich protein-like n=1 Tax=Aquila chrysaetos chrysaetos TaxID=223781 RepID=UPI001B7D38A5|nr:basic proline-rich protein-like [Aquila chrysaetos chrysaetos]